MTILKDQVEINGWNIFENIDWSKNSELPQNSGNMFESILWREDSFYISIGNIWKIKTDAYQSDYKHDEIIKII